MVQASAIGTFLLASGGYAPQPVPRRVARAARRGRLDSAGKEYWHMGHVDISAIRFAR